MKPLIRIQGISHAYQKGTILSGVSLDIYKGDVSILRGPSGCGKSTFLRILSGIEYPGSGIVTFDGISTQDVTFGRFYREHIGVFFTDFVFFEASSARENIMFPSVFGGYVFSEGIFQSCIHRLEIAHLLDTPVNQLSSGERERIAIARMLVSNPEILILDEPFSHLDERLYAIALGFLSDYAREHLATLWVVTHDRGFSLDNEAEYRIEKGSLTRI